MKYSWLSACSVIALAAAASAAAKPVDTPSPFDRAQAVASVRAALLSGQPVLDEADLAEPAAQQLAQWYNWPNWGNWNNWQNWGNWGNWGNY